MILCNFKIAGSRLFFLKFEESIRYANKIKIAYALKKSRASLLYGMVLEKRERADDAENELRAFDAPYNYFMERLELARFLNHNEKKEAAMLVYQELIKEFESMSKQSLSTHLHIIKKAKEELAVQV